MSAADDRPRAEQRSIADLFTDLVDQAAQIARKEVQLFRAEIGEKGNQAFTAVGLVVAGLVLALVAANAVVAALIGAIAAWGLAEGWAALIVGLVIAAIGYALIKGGMSGLKASKLTPGRTARSLQQDATVARDTAR